MNAKWIFTLCKIMAFGLLEELYNQTYEDQDQNPLL